jgi:hypothetical protein
VAEPPRDAVRVVDNVRATRPDLLLHSREPGGMRMLIEVKSIAFGMSRYSTRWHLDGSFRIRYQNSSFPETDQRRQARAS